MARLGLLLYSESLADPVLAAHVFGLCDHLRPGDCLRILSPQAPVEWAHWELLRRVASATGQSTTGIAAAPSKHWLDELLSLDADYLCHFPSGAWGDARFVKLSRDILTDYPKVGAIIRPYRQIGGFQACEMRMGPKTWQRTKYADPDTFRREYLESAPPVCRLETGMFLNSAILRRLRVVLSDTGAFDGSLAVHWAGLDAGICFLRSCFCFYCATDLDSESRIVSCPPACLSAAQNGWDRFMANHPEAGDYAAKWMTAARAAVNDHAVRIFEHHMREARLTFREGCRSPLSSGLYYVAAGLRRLMSASMRRQRC